jgi:hypothetical protein
MMIDYFSPYNSFILTFEDDGKVAYAYLKKNGKIVGDVWLYNRCGIPRIPEWTDPNNIPFANCNGYMSEEGLMNQEVEIGHVLVDWEQEETGPIAYVYIFENLYGVVGLNDKPGYARFAIKDSPIAKVMDIEE